jgi:hypothetical protein
MLQAPWVGLSDGENTKSVACLIKIENKKIKKFLWTIQSNYDIISFVGGTEHHKRLDLLGFTQPDQISRFPVTHW